MSIEQDRHRKQFDRALEVEILEYVANADDTGAAGPVARWRQLPAAAVAVMRTEKYRQQLEVQDMIEHGGARMSKEFDRLLREGVVA